MAKSVNSKGGFSVKKDCEPCKINEDNFFKEYKKQFKEKLTSKQKATLTKVLKCINDYYKKKGTSCDMRKIAYLLATAKHETGNFKKFHELGNGKSKDGIDHYFDRYENNKRAKRMGNTSIGDGYRYRGRGLVHLTWKNLYKKAGKALGLDLVNNPELAAEPCNATKIALWGMEGGKFTGVGFSKYINKNMTDYDNARRIINGKDKARKIARYAKKMKKTLKKVKPC